MRNENPTTGSLSISAPGGTFNPLTPSTPDGTEKVTFPGDVPSAVTYFGFDSVAPS
jgi:hypothetical protein